MPDEIELIQFTDDNDKLVTYHGLLFAPLQGPKETLMVKEGLNELSLINSKCMCYSGNR
jgi:hypothetical protein